MRMLRRKIVYHNGRLHYGLEESMRRSVPTRKVREILRRDVRRLAGRRWNS